MEDCCGQPPSRAAASSYVTGKVGDDVIGTTALAAAELVAFPAGRLVALIAAGVLAFTKGLLLVALIRLGLTAATGAGCTTGKVLGMAGAAGAGRVATAGAACVLAGLLGMTGEAGAEADTGAVDEPAGS